MINRFNIRVYGIWLNTKNQVLVSNEKYGNVSFTKFPGGGLEFGESTHQCLKREFLEEFGVEVNIASHFYTTDIFVPSAFVKTDQLISIYYLVSGNEGELIFDEFRVQNKDRLDTHKLKWHTVDETLSNALTFPIDKLVAQLLCK